MRGRLLTPLQHGTKPEVGRKPGSAEPAKHRESFEKPVGDELDAAGQKGDASEHEKAANHLLHPAKMHTETAEEAHERTGEKRRQQERYAKAERIGSEK